MPSRHASRVGAINCKEREEKMGLSRFSAAVLLSLVIAFPASAAIEFELDDSASGVMQFRDEGSPPTDGSFEFPDAVDFIITSVNYGAGFVFGPAVDLPVNIIGKFYIDEIFDVGGDENSTVTSPGGPNFTIKDLNSVLLTGTLEFNQISTEPFHGQLNALLDANLSNIQYTGTNPDLLQLKNTAALNGSVYVGFGPVRGHTLSDLVNGNVGVTSYDGLVSSEGTPGGNTSLIPEPASALVWTFLSMVAGGIVCVRRNLRQANGR
jgi:hypothetical protein